MDVVATLLESDPSPLGVAGSASAIGQSAYAVQPQFTGKQGYLPVSLPMMIQTLEPTLKGRLICSACSALRCNGCELQEVEIVTKSRTGVQKERAELVPTCRPHSPTLDAKSWATIQPLSQSLSSHGSQGRSRKGLVGKSSLRESDKSCPS